jgi:hypothetical protein
MAANVGVLSETFRATASEPFLLTSHNQSLVHSALISSVCQLFQVDPFKGQTLFLRFSRHWSSAEALFEAQLAPGVGTQMSLSTNNKMLLGYPAVGTVRIENIISVLNLVLHGSTYLWL